MRGRGAAIALAGVLIATAGAASRAPDAAAAPQLHRHKIGSFHMPVYVDNAPGARHLLFVVEQPGRIQVLRSGHELRHSFLDLSDRVSCCAERGLLSVAFDPAYARNRRFFVVYTNESGNVEVDGFKRRHGSATRASRHSRRRVIVVPHEDAGSHNGGQLQFDSKGRLYLSTGDGGIGGDPDGNAQNPDSLLGKILRIVPKAGGGYRAPAGNPFVGGPGRNPVFALGLRNPWRFSFDRVTGDLWVGDVGWSAQEEIDHTTLAAAKGANFGWNLFEGDDPCVACPPDDSTPPPDHYAAPVHTYPHSDPGGEHGSAIIGGYVVRSRGLASIRGRYVYADFALGDLRAFNPATGDSRWLGLHVDGPSAFGEGRGGRIYVASLGGPVYELVQ